MWTGGGVGVTECPKPIVSAFSVTCIEEFFAIRLAGYGGPWQGSGRNPEAKLLLLDHAFDDLGAIRVAFKCDAQNEQSRRGIARIGGTFEGVLRKHSLRGDASGTQRDTAYFSIIDDEWPEVRARLVALKDR